MNIITSIGKVLILFGFIMMVIGLLFYFSGKIPFIGRLPGDVFIQRKNATFYFPITTSILIGIILSLIFWIISKIR